MDRFRRALLGWYDQHRRQLPWRETRDPYRIWISEIMLQQTRVAAVLEHYRLFLERFPNLRMLAAASLDSVLAAWSGLGYYRRARMLHLCAQQIVGEYAGSFPRDSGALLALPGIGRYTAAAIASIAFDEPVAVVDGNVERVLQRFTGANLTKAQTWAQAQSLLDKGRPGDSNQAMMELGATVCLPGTPLCTMCPVRNFCAVKGAAPRTAPVGRRKKREFWCAIEWQGGNDRVEKIRLVQRAKDDSQMPGMWELEQSAKAAGALLRSSPWRKFRHSITTTDYTVHVIRKKVANSAIAKKGRWIAIERIPEMPITGLTRKILRAGGLI